MKRFAKTTALLLVLSLMMAIICPTISYGKNLGENEGWLEVTASTSSNANSSLTAQNLVDGNEDSFWSSSGYQTDTPPEGDYAVLSFQGTASVSKIVITPRKGFTSTFPKDFKLQYTINKKDWIDLASYEDYQATEEEQVFTFDQPIEAKKVRIVGTRYGVDDFNTYYMQIAEMKVYGSIIALPNPPIWGSSPITEPYEYVADGSFSGEEQPYSPDPLVNYRWDNPTADDDLEIFLRKPVSATTEQEDAFQRLDSATTDNVDIEVTGEGTILLDFGVEFAGWLEIDSPDLSGELTLGVSEYNQPAFVNSGPQSPSKTAAPVKYGDTYRLELNSELYEGVQFGFINVTNFDQPFHISDIRLVCQTKPVNYEGSFDSDNEMLNKIWYTAAYDVRANLKKDYMAAILMDRGDRHSWTGDAYPTQAASLVAFYNTDFVLENMRYTSTRSNGIESYELYWVLSLIDYYEYTGDQQGVKSLLSEATKRLDHAYDIYGTNPNLGFYGWDERLGAGFENPNIEENQNGYQLLSIQAWKDFSEVLRDLGETELADKYQGYADEKTAELQSDPKWYQKYGIHAFSDAVNADVLPEEAEAQIAETYFTDRINRLSYSPFNQYFILQAMGETGRYDDAISSILDLWGGQIEYGGTTFFETYRPQWNAELDQNGPVPNNQAGYTSLAHPWSAGVLPWMNEEILGIHATQPGFTTFEVTPHLGRQLTRVSGSTMTPYGKIEVSFDTNTGDCSVIVPEGTTAKIGIPKVEKEITSISMNGALQEIKQQDETFVYFEVSGGNYQFKVNYEGTTPTYTAPAYKYDAEILGTDTTTQGNWGGVYGSEGYVLCAYNGGDVRVLPDYVEDIQYTKASSTQWATDTTDVRALASNRLNLENRNLGALYTNDPIACQQTFTVDIQLKEQREYTVALYFVDWDSDNTRQLAIEMFDGDTLNMVAPVKVVKDYSDGAYVIYQYDKSARFRIDQMRGANATLSGIFFGTGMGDDPIITTTTVDDQDPQVSYEGNWTHDPIQGACNETFSYSNIAGNKASFQFEGDGIALLASRESNRGIAQVIVDGTPYDKIDLYSPTIIRQSEVFRLDNLSEGTHTIEVVVTGEQNPAASGCYVDVDAFVVSNIVQTVESVASQLETPIIAQDDTQLTMPEVPEGFIVELTNTSHPEIISLDGKITNPETDTEVELTFTVSKDGRSATAVRTVSVPGKPAEPVETNKDILNKVIAYAENAADSDEFDNVIADVQETFKAALDAAKLVAKDDMATQETVDAAWKALLTEIHKLGFVKGDITSLEDLVALAETYDINDYVEAGQAEFQEALKAAQELLADKDNAMAEEIEVAESNLLNAMLNLRYKADKSILEKVIAEANEVDSNAYTAESYAVLEAAVAEANTVMANEDATQEEVDAAVTSVQEAMKGLVAVEIPTNETPADNNADGTQTGQESTTTKANAAKTGDTTPVAGAIAATIVGVVLLAIRKKNK